MFLDTEDILDIIILNWPLDTGNQIQSQFKSITLGSYIEEMSSSPLIYLHPSLSTEDRVVSSVEGVGG